MPTNSILVDSNFLYALYNKDEVNHLQALEFVKRDNRPQIIPDVILPEVAFLFNRYSGEPAVITFLEALEKSQPILQPVLVSDIQRVREIMTQYRYGKLDLVDCCIMAIAERLNITRVLTFDRRDFSIFRPKHCEYLELLP